MKNRIKLLSLFLALALCLSLLPVSALAAGTKSTVLGSGKCGDNVTWKLTDDGVMTISGSGPMYNYDMMGLDGDYNEETYVPWDSFYEDNKCYIGLTEKQHPAPKS